MFKWKEYVYEIYKERNFSRAAQNLYISQPSLSAKIKKIEDEIGAPIFDRSTSPLRLTEIGKLYIEAAEEIERSEGRFKNRVNDIFMLKSGKLSIGASNVFAAYALPPIITEFKNRYPDVDITLVEGNTSTLEEMLGTNSLDMVIDNNHYPSELYDKELYAEETILLAVPKGLEVPPETEKFRLSEDALISHGYRSEDYPAVPLSLFADQPFVMLAPSNDTRIRGERLCRDAGFRPRIILELNQQATAYMVASTRMGITFVSDTLVERLPAHENLDYYKLSGDAASRKVYFYFKKHKFKTGAMEEFIKLIKER